MKELQQYSTDDPVAGEELKALRDYAGTLVETYILQEGVKDLPPERWDPDNGILIGILAAYMILESLLIGDFTVAKGILLLAVYAGFITTAYIILWHSSTENTENTEGRSFRVPIHILPKSSPYIYLKYVNSFADGCGKMSAVFNIHSLGCKRDIQK